MKNTYRILNPPVSPQGSRGSCALAVMIKAPRAGASKTRLVPPLTPKEAAELSVCFFRDTAANIESVTADVAAEGIAVYTPAGFMAFPALVYVTLVSFVLYRLWFAEQERLFTVNTFNYLPFALLCAFSVLRFLVARARSRTLSGFIEKEAT